MKLTSKGRYAVMALADLAKFNSEYPVSLRDISLRQGISLDFLEQIFSKLKKHHIVKSIRGTNGGYILSANPEQIKLAKILNAVDEEVEAIGVSYTSGGMTISANQYEAKGAGNSATAKSDKWSLSAAFAF